MINDLEIASDPGKLQQNWAELEEVRSLVEQLYQRWVNLKKGKKKGAKY